MQGLNRRRYLGGDVVSARHGPVDVDGKIHQRCSVSFGGHPAISLNSKNQGIHPIFIDSWDERSDNMMGIYWIYWLYPPEDGGILPNKW